MKLNDDDAELIRKTKHPLKLAPVSEPFPEEDRDFEELGHLPPGLFNNATYNQQAAGAKVVYSNGPFGDLHIDQSFTNWMMKENISVVGPSAERLAQEEEEEKQRIRQVREAAELKVRELLAKIKTLEAEEGKIEDGEIRTEIPEGRKLRL